MKTTVVNIPVNKLTQSVDEALEHLDKIRRALPFLIMLSTNDRKHAAKLQENEPQLFEGIASAVSRFESLFHAANIDGKSLAALIDRHQTLLPLSRSLRTLAQSVDDTMMELGSALKEQVSSAYHLGVALSAHNPGLKTALEPARRFYSAPARKRARAKRASQRQTTNSGIASNASGVTSKNS